jgi:phage terminase Nu1 subunit (DNA packaging protein)
MSLMPPTPIRLVPGLLRARGLKVSSERIRIALENGAIPGRREQRYWVLTPEDVDAAERYFRKAAAPGASKGGAAGLDQARRRSQQGHAG